MQPAKNTSSPSKIDTVGFDRIQAAPGDTGDLQIRIPIKLVDAQGTVPNTLSGQLVGENMNLQFRVLAEVEAASRRRITAPRPSRRP